MALSPGALLGPYEIIAPIGAGGMGEVYRARDTKLNRDVAIKVLPESFALDADRVARFTREAQVLASLNHPNIAAIYGIESNALVMELVDGEDLSAVIARGPIALVDALPIARQIADALETAHEQGIVHRDLKPQNIKVRADGTIKVLDFGLAKATDPTGSSSVSAMNSPTMTSPAMTGMGMILGTAAYMSPEQAKGRAVDKRADIWAFGVVLFEMLAGTRAFRGDDVSEILVSVLRDTVDLNALPPSAPRRLRALISRCLERDVKLRLRDIGEARVELAKIADGREDVSVSAVVVPAASRPSKLSWIVAAVGVIAAAYFGWSAMTRSPAGVSSGSLRLQLNLDADQSLLGSDPNEIRVDRRTVMEDATDGRVIEDKTTGGRVAGGAYLVFMRGATLLAAPFNVESATVTGPAQGMIDGVMASVNAPNTSINIGAGEFTASEDGTLVYLPGQIFADTTATLTWLDRQGHTHPVSMEPRSYQVPRLSPDDRLALTNTIGVNPGWAFWIHDFARGTTSKVPFDGTVSRSIWSPDGKAVVFSGSRASDRGFYRVPIDNLGAVERLPGGVRVPAPAGWARDGHELVFVENVRTIDGGTGTDDIFAVSLDDKKTRPLVQTKGRDDYPAMSPNGQWLAYSTDETGPFEVFVQAYAGGSRVRISQDGGIGPRWTRDGNTLIYSKQIPDPKDSNRARFEMWEVPLTITSVVIPGRPRKFADLSQEEFGSGGPLSNYDVAADGRILGTTREFNTPPPGRTLSVITNWFEELRVKATVKK